jgi:hypothetical protein
VKDNDVRAANTGITETTREPTPYKYPTNSNICFWDLPGIGTVNYPNLQDFSEEVVIEAYDTFLIIAAGRFTQYDIELAEKVKSMGKSFFFVRTKIDNDMRSERRKKGFNEEKMLKTIRVDCVKSLQALNIAEDKVFLISNYHPTKWDFHHLKNAILDELPSKQKESFTLSLHNDSKDILNKKTKLLKGMCGTLVIRI